MLLGVELNDVNPNFRCWNLSSTERKTFSPLSGTIYSADRSVPDNFWLFSCIYRKDQCYSLLSTYDAISGMKTKAKQHCKNYSKNFQEVSQFRVTFVECLTGTARYHWVLCWLGVCVDTVCWNPVDASFVRCIFANWKEETGWGCETSWTARFKLCSYWWETSAQIGLLLADDEKYRLTYGKGTFRFLKLSFKWQF